MRTVAKSGSVIDVRAPQWHIESTPQGPRCRARSDVDMAGRLLWDRIEWLVPDPESAAACLFPYGVCSAEKTCTRRYLREQFSLMLAYESVI